MGMAVKGLQQETLRFKTVNHTRAMDMGHFQKRDININILSVLFWNVTWILNKALHINSPVQ